MVALLEKRWCMNNTHPHEEDEKAKKVLLRTALKMIYYQSEKYYISTMLFIKEYEKVVYTFEKGFIWSFASHIECKKYNRPCDSDL